METQKDPYQEFNMPSPKHTKYQHLIVSIISVKLNSISTDKYYILDSNLILCI